MVNMNSVESIAIPEGDVRVISDANGPIWFKQEYIDIDLLPYVQDQIGWWNYAWTSCSGFGADTNWSFATSWIPLGEGKLTYKLYLHDNVGHLTAWDENGIQLGYICGQNGKSNRQSEWELPTGTKWLRICIAYPKGSIGSKYSQNLRFVGKDPLPRRYQRLNGITSTGTQYIDTGLIPNTNHVIDMWMTPTQPTGNNKFFGMYGGISGAFIGCDNNVWRIGTNYIDSAIPITGGTIRVRNHEDNWYFGNVLDGGQSASCAWIGTGNQSYLLFGCRCGETGQQPIQYGSMTCHLLKIGLRQNSNYKCVMGIPQLCLIPARDLLTGELGMYDYVSGMFKTNSGTGSFIAA